MASVSLASWSFTGNVEIDGINYYIVTKGQDAEVIGCKSGITDLVIPETVEYEGVVCKVTSIRNRAFVANRKLTSVTLPNSIEKIDHYAFYECENLKSITIPQSVTYLGLGVFGRCKNLSEVNITSIYQWLNIINDAGTFSYPYSLLIDGSHLTELVIPNGVNEIKPGTFEQCASIEKILFGEEIKSIGDYAFGGCTNIKEIIIPECVISIGEHAFEGCTSMEQLELSGNVVAIAKYAFSGCTNLRVLRIPEGVEQIKAYAFSGCTGLEKVYLPSSLKKMQERIFSGCTEITDIYVFCKTVPSTNASFSNIGGIQYITLHVPASSIDSYKSKWSDFGNIVALTDEELAIDATTINTNEYKQYFTTDGKLIERPQKGINIVKMSNGQTKKIIVK